MATLDRRYTTILTTGLLGLCLCAGWRTSQSRPHAERRAGIESTFTGLPWESRGLELLGYLVRALQC